jgi:hypothetical protein
MHENNPGLKIRNIAVYGSCMFGDERLKPEDIDITVIVKGNHFREKETAVTIDWEAPGFKGIVRRADKMNITIIGEDNVANGDIDASSPLQPADQRQFIDRRVPFLADRIVLCGDIFADNKSLRDSNLFAWVSRTLLISFLLIDDQKHNRRRPMHDPAMLSNEELKMWRMSKAAAYLYDACIHMREANPDIGMDPEKIFELRHKVEKEGMTLDSLDKERQILTETFEKLYKETPAIHAARAGAEKAPIERLNSLITEYFRDEKHAELAKVLNRIKASLEKEPEYAEEAVKLLESLISVYKDSKQMLGTINLPDAQRYIFMPLLSKKLCNLPEGQLQNKAQEVWKEFRTVLLDEYRIGDIVTLVFYDGTLDDLKSKMGRYGAALEPANTFIYTDRRTNPETNMNEGLLKGYYKIGEDVVKDGEGYIPIGAQIALAISILQLHAISDKSTRSTILAGIKSTLKAMEANNVEFATADELLNAAVRGDLKITLPRITKINIEKHIAEYCLAEEAAMKSL